MKLTESERDFLAKWIALANDWDATPNRPKWDDYVGFIWHNEPRMIALIKRLTDE
jgi:hypothetical protein